MGLANLPNEIFIYIFNLSENNNLLLVSKKFYKIINSNWRDKIDELDLNFPGWRIDLKNTLELSSLSLIKFLLQYKKNVDFRYLASHSHNQDVILWILDNYGKIIMEIPYLIREMFINIISLGFLNCLKKIFDTFPSYDFKINKLILISISFKQLHIFEYLMTITPQDIDWLRILEYIAIDGNLEFVLATLIHLQNKFNIHVLSTLFGHMFRIALQSGKLNIIIYFTSILVINDIHWELIAEKAIEIDRIDILIYTFPHLLNQNLPHLIFKSIVYNNLFILKYLMSKSNNINHWWYAYLGKAIENGNLHIIKFLNNKHNYIWRIETIGIYNVIIEHDYLDIIKYLETKVRINWSEILNLADNNSKIYEYALQKRSCFNWII